MKTLSVIIPIYKVESYLRQCLDSVVNQTYRNMEIILIDDGSPDNCGMICDEYAARDGRVRVIHKENAGVSAARNEGIRLATGDWITFVDADDWCERDYYERIFSELPDVAPDVFIAGGYYEELMQRVYTRYTFDRPFYDAKGEWRVTLIAKTMAQKCGMEDGKLEGSVAVCWNKVYRTSFLRESGCVFKEKLHPLEDILFHMQVFSRADVVASCSCIGYHYRSTNEGSSLHRFNAAWPMMFDTCARTMNTLICEELKKENLPEDSECAKLLRAAYHIRILSMMSMIIRCYFFHEDNPVSYRQAAGELRVFKKRPYVATMIHDGNSRLMSGKQEVLKWLLSLPWIWPLKLANNIKERLK